jgi:hypothetical protein
MIRPQTSCHGLTATAQTSVMVDESCGRHVVTGVCVIGRTENIFAAWLARL